MTAITKKTTGRKADPAKAGIAAPKRRGETIPIRAVCCRPHLILPSRKDTVPGERKT